MLNLILDTCEDQVETVNLHLSSTLAADVYFCRNHTTWPQKELKANQQPAKMLHADIGMKYIYHCNILNSYI